MIKALILALALIGPAMGSTLSPTSSFHSWVAGSGDPGSLDGLFMTAQFHHPRGIVHDPSTERLWVVDAANHALRSIDLADKNAASTLPLTSEADPKAVFALPDPSRLEWQEPGRTLLCLDASIGGLAVIDIATGKAHWAPVGVTGPASPILGAASFHKDEAGKLWFCFAGAPKLCRYDPVSGTVEAFGLSGLQAPGLDDLMTTADGFFGLSHQGVGGGLRRLPDALLALTMTAAPGASWPVEAMAVDGSEAAWSFLRGHKGLAVGCDLAGVMLIRDDRGDWKAWHLMDAWGRRIGVDNEMTPIFSPTKVQFAPAVSHLLADRILTRRPTYLCEDARGDKWYMSDTDGNRILALRPTDPEDPVDESDHYADGFMESSYAPHKAPGTIRVAVYGSSYFQRVADNRIKARSFTKRLEWYLNFYSSMSGGPRYEVMATAHPFSDRDSMYNSLLRVQDKLQRVYGIDDLLLCFHPRDLANVVRPYLQYPPSADGLPLEDWDPDFAIRPKRASDIKDKAYKALAEYCQKMPVKAGTIFAENGLLHSADEYGESYRFYGSEALDEGFMDRLEQLHVEWLSHCKQQIDVTGTTLGHHMGVTLLHVAELQSLGRQEAMTNAAGEQESVDLRPFRRLFASLCRRTGVRPLDLFDESRVYAFDQPFVSAEYHHMGSDGCDLMAQIAAYRYLNMKAQAP